MSRANLGMLTNPIAIMTLKSDGPRAAEMANARRILGKARITSMARMMRLSIRPPKYPAISPSAVPTKKARLTEISPTDREIREPKITRVSTSRPSSSVPKGWVKLGGDSIAPKFVSEGPKGVRSGATRAVMVTTAMIATPNNALLSFKNSANLVGFFATTFLAAGSPLLIT